MKNHVCRPVYRLIPPDKESGSGSISRNQSTIALYLQNKASISTITLFKQNLICWVVLDIQLFTVIETPSFKSLIHDILGISLPFSSANILQERIRLEFAIYRTKLKQILCNTCNSIVLSLDVWTSKNSLPILGIIGYWYNKPS